MPFEIIVNSSAGKELKRVEENAEFQEFTTFILEVCAISFTLRGNAFEGYKFEIPDSQIVDRSSVIQELIDGADKLA